MDQSKNILRIKINNEYSLKKHWLLSLVAKVSIGHQLEILLKKLNYLLDNCTYVGGHHLQG